MSRISDILARKGSQVFTIPEGATVIAALAEMERHNTGSLVVVRGSEVAGIFTERDLARRVALGGRDVERTLVREVMTAQVICIESGATVHEAMTLMSQERIRHLPVVSPGGMCGVVSIGDLVQSLAAEQAVEIRYLTAYIRGELAV